ncbi:hypothetical protein V6N13_038590 [Hibiscus sabdariffa]
MVPCGCRSKLPVMNEGKEISFPFPFSCIFVGFCVTSRFLIGLIGFLFVGGCFMVGLPSDQILDSRRPGVLDAAKFPPLQAANTMISDAPGLVGSGSSSLEKWNFLDQSLPYFPPLERDGSVLVKPSSEILVDGARQWKNALLGNFLGKSPPLGIFQKTVDRLWGSEGSIEIRFLARSVYVLNFPSQKVRDWILESGSWHIQQKAIILRKWLPGMIPEVLDLSSAPIWIKLWHVPLELISQKGLGCIASALEDKCVKKKEIVSDFGLNHVVDSGSSSGFPVDSPVQVPVNPVQSQNSFNVLVDGQVLELRNILTLVRKLGVEVLCLLETRVKELNSTVIVQKYFSGWKFINNYSAAPNGRVWLLYKGPWQDLGEVQHDILLNPAAGDMAREKQISLELTQLLRAEGKFFRQKSRVHFIKEGDNNSTYFFRQVNARQSFNSVRALHDLHGHKLESFDSISSELVRHFTEALGTVDQNVVPFSDELLKELVGVEISADMRDLLVALVTSKEIKGVLFAMNGNKAPSPYRYPASFFQLCS